MSPVVPASRIDAAADTAVGDASVILQAASVLLSYPSPQCEDELQLIGAALAELPESRARRRLCEFLGWWGEAGAAAREQRYVATFDLDRDVSLYLTEAGPGTARERGAALLELRAALTDAGVCPPCGELPDYLPLLLEAAAHAPACRGVLGARRPALEGLQRALERARSPFALVVSVLLEEGIL